MLKKQTISAILPLAEMLAERGVRLETVPGTIMGNLTMASASVRPGDADVESVLAAVSSPVDTGRRDEEGVAIILPSEHGYTQQRAVTCIAKGVQEMVGNARNVVLPAIKGTRAYIDEYVDANSKARNIIPSVDVYNYDPLWGGALVDGIANQYNKVDLIGMPTAAIPELTEEQLRALVNSGSQEIRDFIAREDTECPGHLTAIWHTWFCNRPLSNSDDFVFLSRMLVGSDKGRMLTAGGLGDGIDARKGYDAIITAFLIANALYDNPIAGVNWGMDLSRYNLVMSGFKAHFGKVIGRVYGARVSALENKTLIINMPVIRNWRLGEASDNILLNGDVHKWYLENGGSIEAVIGNVFTQRVVSGRTLLDLRPQYEAAYDNVVNTYTGLAVTNRHRFTIEALTASVVGHVVGIDPEFWLKLHSDYTKQQVISDLQKYLASGLPIGTSDSLDKIITYCYTQFVYATLRVDDFIQAMNNYPDQSLNPSAIASHVIIDMVIKSLMSDTYYNTQS